MSNIKPIKPSHTFGYWRPWKEDSNFFDSYLDYVRDTSLVKYGADTVGSYINQASKEQIQAISELGQAIGRGMNVLSNQMSDINDSLIFLNRNLDIQIEQQKLSNLLLQNIAELLRVPNSEKERQHSIELGIKFFVNAKKNKALYEDALEELLKAESLMKQDYFVLHRIGCIYLYVEKFINPEKALDYFLRAAKYASVESDSQAVRLVNAMNNVVNSKDKNSIKQIKLLAADSYEKAAFAAYILGQFSDAVNYQTKALSYSNNSKIRFLLSKYQIRSNDINKAIKNLSQCIDEDPIYVVAIFKEIDLINESEVRNLIINKTSKIDYEINELLNKWNSIKFNETNNDYISLTKKAISELSSLSKKPYEIKVLKFEYFNKNIVYLNDKFDKEKKELNYKIDVLIHRINNTIFMTLDSIYLQKMINELNIAKDLVTKKTWELLLQIDQQIDDDELKIGAKYAGGIVFHIDNTGKHGLVCADEDFGEAVWGSFGDIGASKSRVGYGDGMINTKKIVELASWNITGFFNKTKTPVPTAARLCLESNHNGFKDWYLPTYMELWKIINNLSKASNNIIKLKKGTYWSSEESIHNWQSDYDKSVSKYSARVCCLKDSFKKLHSKKEKAYVIAVRAF
jgi:tetratricopeptide (TPR) repeat protein